MRLRTALRRVVLRYNGRRRAMSKVMIRCFARDNGPHNGFALSEYHRLLNFQNMDRFKVHQRVVDGATADVIIFVGPEFSTFLDFRRSDEWRKYPEKCFIYYGGDRPLPLLPGVYTSLERRFYAPSWTRTASYLRADASTFTSAAGAPRTSDGRRSYNRCRPSQT